MLGEDDTCSLSPSSKFTQVNPCMSGKARVKLYDAGGKWQNEGMLTLKHRLA